MLGQLGHWAGVFRLFPPQAGPEARWNLEGPRKAFGHPENSKSSRVKMLHAFFGPKSASNQALSQIRSADTGDMGHMAVSPAFEQKASRLFLASTLGIHA